MADAKGIKMGQGYVSLGVDRSPLDAGLEAARSKFEAWGKGIAALGAAIAAGGAMITAPFLGGLGEFASWGSTMRTAMRESNMNFTEARTAMNGLGLSAEELPTVTARVAEFVEAARNGSREANAALADMGIGLSDLASASHGDRLNMLADGLNRIGDSGLRMTRQRDIFRGSGLSMNIGGGSEGIRQRAARRDYLQGDSYGVEGQRVAADYARAQGELGTATSAIWQSLAMAAAPIMADFYRRILVVVVAVREWIDANRPLLAMIFQVGTALTTAGAAIGFVGGAIYAASYAFTFFSGAMGIVNTVLSFFGGIVMTGLGIGLAVLKSGFGLLTVATSIWGAATLAWTALVAAATTSYAVGHAITTAIITAAQWAYNAAMVVYSAVTGAGTIATIVYVASLIKAWLWEVAVSGGLWLIVTAAVAATVALGALAIAIGVVTGGWALFAVGAVAVTAVGDAIPRITGFFRELAGVIGASAQWQAFLDGLNAIGETAQRVFAAIRMAVSAGEMGLAWQIVADGAMLAFERLRGAIVPIWYSVTDRIVDAFRDAFATVQIVARVAWNAIAGVFTPIIRQMLNGLIAVTAATPGMERMNNRLVMMAGNMVHRNQDAGAIVDQVMREREAERRRDAGLRAERDRAFAAGNRERVAELDARLGGREEQAGEVFAIDREMQAIRKQMADLTREGGPMAGGKIAFSSAGSFNRFTPFVQGWDFNTTPTETAEARDTRLAREHLEQILRQLEQRREVVMR